MGHMMNNNLQNPFNITKAVDFSDQQINDYWVDMPNGGFKEMAKPLSPMPMIILGGKGSGKTHLMRYFSYPLQKIRFYPNIIKGIVQEGCIGIYFRCSGLNSYRFKGKGQDDETWKTVFTHYMDLWIAQLVLSTTHNVFQNRAEFNESGQVICNDIISLFDRKDFPLPKSLNDMIHCLHEMQRQIDDAVNNCSITGKLEVSIRAKPASLVFGIPGIMVKRLPVLNNILFLYLIDEFENLTDEQQKYFNTLIREKKAPTSIKVGARLYGIHTYGTYSADEEIKEGSEYERLPLDELLREKTKEYKTFVKRLCARRLTKAGYFPEVLDNLDSIAESLSSFFEVPEKGRFASKETSIIVEKYGNRERPYLKFLRSKLKEGLNRKIASGISNESDITVIINNLAVPEYPLLEKTNIFLLYQDWFSNINLIKSSQKISEQCKRYIQNPSEEGRYNQVFSHFQGDLMAQLLRDCNRKQRYLGLDTFIEMSCGLPRNLLIILKNIFRWSSFNGETPFRNMRISINSQQKGVIEASDWFYKDARKTGVDGRIIRDSIDRLARLFRDIRFSDKPSECSLSTFSIDVSQVSEKARYVLEEAENWSLLINITGGQRDRNTKRVDEKYQINRMLAPRWNLPISRRGALALNPEEANAIFDPDCSQLFETIRKKRIGRMMAPYFGKSDSKTPKTNDQQLILSCLEND